MKQELKMLEEAQNFIDNPSNLSMIQMIANDMNKWIPVTEEKPEIKPNGTGSSISDVVLILTDEKKIMAALFDGLAWIAAFNRSEVITHWMPLKNLKVKRNG